MVDRIIGFLLAIWQACSAFVFAVRGSKIVSLVMVKIWLILSAVLQFFVTMTPWHDPALGRRGAEEAPQQEEIHYVRRIDTGGQQRCR